MVIRVKVNLKGLDILEPKIMKAVQRGLKKTGLAIERDAKIKSPLDTGRLRASIHSNFKGRFTIVVQDNVHYGVFQELGTRFMKPNPFMKPALLKNIGKIPRFIQEELRRVLR